MSSPRCIHPAIDTLHIIPELLCAVQIRRAAAEEEEEEGAGLGKGLLRSLEATSRLLLLLQTSFFFTSSVKSPLVFFSSSSVLQLFGTRSCTHPPTLSSAHPAHHHQPHPPFSIFFFSAEWSGKWQPCSAPVLPIQG